jgi:hypothetical protein
VIQYKRKRQEMNQIHIQGSSSQNFSGEMAQDLSFIQKFKIDSKYNGIQTNVW